MGRSKNTLKNAPAALDPNTPEGRAVVGAIVVWGLAWKAASLWTAAKNGSKPWFATLFVSNTLGILDAVYIFGVSRRRRARERAALASDAQSSTGRTQLEHGELDL